MRLAVVIAAVSMAALVLALFKRPRSPREYTARPYRALREDADGLPVTRAADTSAVVHWRWPETWVTH